MKKKDKTRKLVMASVLAAIGLLLCIIELPYPIAPWLKMDISEVPVLLASSMLGLYAAVFVSFCKFFVSILVQGPVGPFAIGQITSLIGSLCLAITYSSMIKLIMTKYKVLNYWMAMIVSVLVFSAVMFIANYTFITPTYLLGKPSWYTSMDASTIKNFTSLSSHLILPRFLQVLSPYEQAVFIIYMPFNMIKGVVIAIVFSCLQPLLTKYPQK